MKTKKAKDELGQLRSKQAKHKPDSLPYRLLQERIDEVSRRQYEARVHHGR